MKLRLKGNALRLRLTQSELDQLRTDRRVEEHVPLGPGQRLTYALEATGGDALGVRYEAGRLTVLLPDGWVEPWAQSSRVGFEAQVPVGEGTVLNVQVEKDFQCLHKRAADQDAFPHPLAGAAD